MFSVKTFKITFRTIRIRKLLHGTYSCIHTFYVYAREIRVIPKFLTCALL